MGRTVLSSQFVAGLRADIKAKVAGVDGNFDQLLTKARFEEARLRDVIGPARSSLPTQGATTPCSPPQIETLSQIPNPMGGRGSKTCYHCGSTGHIVKYCPLCGRSAPVEAQGGTRPRGNVATLVPQSLQRKGMEDNESALDLAFQKVMATMQDTEPELVNPRPTTTVSFLQATPEQSAKDGDHLSRCSTEGNMSEEAPHYPKRYRRLKMADHRGGQLRTD